MARLVRSACESFPDSSQVGPVEKSYRRRGYSSSLSARRCSPSVRAVTHSGHKQSEIVDLEITITEQSFVIDPTDSHESELRPFNGQKL